MTAVGIWPNPEKEQVRGLTRDLARWLLARGVEPWCPPDLGDWAGLPDATRRVADWNETRFVVVLGGDGTLLRAAKELAHHRRPLLGVNLGHLGFLTEVEVPDVYAALTEFLAGRYVLDARLMLSAVVLRQGQEVARFQALNDVVVTKGPFARLVDLEASVDGSFVTTYRGDGLIISTPTGSTAYSLSAGGPVVNPNLGVVLLTPICPHSFFDRSVVIGEWSTVQVRVRAEHRETLLTVDGQEGFRLEDGDEVAVARDALPVDLMRRPGWNFYHVLRGWQKGR